MNSIKQQQLHGKRKLRRQIMCLRARDFCIAKKCVCVCLLNMYVYRTYREWLWSRKKIQRYWGEEKNYFIETRRKKLSLWGAGLALIERAHSYNITISFASSRSRFALWVFQAKWAHTLLTISSQWRAEIAKKTRHLRFACCSVARCRAGALFRAGSMECRVDVDNHQIRIFFCNNNKKLIPISCTARRFHAKCTLSRRKGKLKKKKRHFHCMPFPIFCRQML